MTGKATICIWYDGTAEEAARFYAETFPDSHVGAIHRSPADNPGNKKGDVIIAEFTVCGIACIGLNIPNNGIWACQAVIDMMTARGGTGSRHSRLRTPLSLSGAPKGIFPVASS
mgnify:CR=1 FL=1